MISDIIKNRRIYILFIVIILLNTSFAAQTKDDFEIINLSDETHKYESSATSLYEDKNGYIWIATTYDMMRYDGSEFFFIDLPPFQQFEFVFAITEYENNILALLSTGKILVIDQNDINGEIKVINTGLNSFHSFRRHNGKIIIMTSKQDMYYFEDMAFTKIKNPGITITNLHSFDNPNKDLYYVSENKLYYLEENELKFYKKLDVDNIQYANLLPNGLLFLLTAESEQFVYDLGNNSKQKMSFDRRTDPTIKTYVDKQNRLWIAANSTLFLSSGDIPSAKNINEIIPDITVSYFYEDRYRNLWVATYGNGVYLIRERKLKTYGTKDGLPGNTFYPIFEFKNDIWASSLSGIGVFKDNKWHEVKSNSDTPISSNREFFTYNNDLYIYPIDIKAELNTVFRYNNKSFIKANIIPDYRKRISGFVNLEGKLWGYSNHQEVISINNEEISIKKLAGLPENAVISDLKFDMNNDLWISTYMHGIYHYNNGTVIGYDTTNGLKNIQITDFAIDPYNNMWIGSFGGMHKLSANGEWEYYTEKDGLSHEVCYSVLADSNFVYIGTHCGITIFDGQTFLRYYTDDGLSSNETSGHSLLKDRNGNIWIGTTRGITLYKPKNDFNLSKNKFKWKISIQTADSLYSYTVQNNTTIKKLDISPSEFPLQISPYVIKYISDESYEYTIKYNDGNSERIEIIDNNEVIINTIKQGNSDLILFTKSKNRNRSVDSLIIPLYVKRHTLLSGFLYYVIIIFILIMIWSIYNWNKRKLKAEKKNNSRQLLTDQLKINSIQAEIENQLVKEKLYLDPTLTLAKFSEKLGQPKEYISHIINTKYQINFNELINSHRIKELQMKLKDPNNAELTILEMAFECGFNSKSSFNLIFKKFTGLTPTQFREKTASD